MDAAAKRGMPLHVVHALPQPPYTVPYTMAEEQQHQDFAQHLVTEARAQAEAADVPLTYDIVESLPVPALLAAAERAAMIVVGSRGHGVISELLLGSVSQHVSRHAPCPVVVVRDQANPQARRIVVGVDGSADCDKAIGFAFDAASRNGADLAAVYAWRDATASTAEGPWVAWSDVAERIAAGERLIDDALSSCRLATDVLAFLAKA